MKTCLNCGKEVPEITKAPCPFCNESKGFGNARSPDVEVIGLSDSATWRIDGHRDIEVSVRHEKKYRVFLIILIVSVTLSGSFAYDDSWITPFVMLAVFFLGGAGFFWPNIMLHRRKVKITPKDGMEFVD